MSTGNGHALDALVAKLSHWGELDADDEAAIHALPGTLRQLKKGSYITREGDRPDVAAVLLSGFAIRHKLTGNGERQVFSIHMRGDLVDIHNSLLKWSDHNVQALNDIEAVFIPVSAIIRLFSERPNVGLLMWHETLVDGSIFREWTLNVGRRDARTRLAHLLCEFAFRLHKTGLGKKLHYELPMTQEQLADAVALTPVHVSRVIRSLSDDGYIAKTNRTIQITDWDGLRSVGDFDPRYLHYDQTQR